MMRKFTMFAIMLLSVSIAFAQKVHPIVGLWQQTNVVKLNDGREFLNRLPVYKLINNDGTYVGILDYVTTVSDDDALPSNMPL